MFCPKCNCKMMYGFGYGYGYLCPRCQYKMNFEVKLMPVIKCPDGVLRSYAEFEDEIKPLWKEQMAKE